VSHAGGGATTRSAECSDMSTGRSGH